MINYCIDSMQQRTELEPQTLLSILQSKCEHKLGGVVEMTGVRKENERKMTGVRKENERNFPQQPYIVKNQNTHFHVTPHTDFLTSTKATLHRRLFSHRPPALNEVDFKTFSYSKVIVNARVFFPFSEKLHFCLLLKNQYLYFKIKYE